MPCGLAQVGAAQLRQVVAQLRVVALRGGRRRLGQHLAVPVEVDHLARAAGEAVADHRGTVAVHVRAGHHRAAHVGAVGGAVLERPVGVRHRAAERLAGQADAPELELGQLAHVERVGGGGEQRAGVDGVALVPHVLHVVRLVLHQRADGGGVDHFAVVRGALGGVDDGEEVRPRQGVAHLGQSAAERARQVLDVGHQGVGDVLVAGPDQQPLLAAAGLRDVLRHQVVGDRVVLAVRAGDVLGGHLHVGVGGGARGGEERGGDGDRHGRRHHPRPSPTRRDDRHVCAPD